jgi:hypothetical protein
MHAQKGVANRAAVSEELVEKGTEALELARAFMQYGEYDDAAEMYDTAYFTLAVHLGESHPLTLAAQHEYSILLTVNHLVADSIHRHMN